MSRRYGYRHSRLRILEEIFEILWIALFKWLWKVISYPFKMMTSQANYLPQHYEYDEEANSEYDYLFVEEEVPFIQLWHLNDEEELALQEIIRTPEETAVIVIINEDGPSKQFKRRIYEHSYIKLDGKKYYLKHELMKSRNGR